ncbi:hypothetical protein SH1V18_18540 [Vallitalea longa]|uniref:DUF3630 family protein n=1 Tax=Vallitalea longa TaxID=2936439 RepID=A0A9W6DG49_9FIRM|nr:hypothetical protein [Vallitalea longa]GKX29374.1 hypothetical protein SH1V18_18540 [Vallitalea longa]
MNLKISKIKNEKNEYEFYFEKLGHWDMFDILAKLILEQTDIKVNKKVDGIAVREWKFIGKDISFYLMHDDQLGNYLLSDNEVYHSDVERLANIILNKILTSFC